MAGVVLTVGLVWFIGSSGERRLDRMENEEQKKILAAYDQMISSAEALNIDGLFSHVIENDQGAVVINGELFLTRAASLERTRANFSGIARLKYRIAERHITMLATDSAVLVASGTSDVELADGRKFSNAFAHTLVFVERDGAWRVIHSHQSSPVQR